MDKDALENEADLATADLAEKKFHPIIRGRVWLCGFFAGLAVGILNLVAAANNWRVIELCDFLDRPVVWFLTTVIDRSHLLPMQGDITVFFSVVTGLLYWAFIGFALAWIFCLLRCGVIVETARDRIFKRALYLGAIMGILIAGLNGLVFANEWTGLEHCFQTLDWPVFALIDNGRDWIPILNSIPTQWYDGFQIGIILVTCYWVVLCMLLMASVCVIRALARRGLMKVAENRI